MTADDLYGDGSNIHDDNGNRHSSSESTLHNRQNSDLQQFDETDRGHDVNESNEVHNDPDGPRNDNEDNNDANFNRLSQEPTHVSPKPHNRVRFRSISNRGTGRNHQPHSPISQRHLSHPKDLAEIPIHERSESWENSELAGSTPLVGHTPAASKDLEATADKFDAENQKLGDESARSRSVKDRWKNAGQILRGKTVRLGERLGRPLDDGEALAARALPEDLGGRGDFAPLTRVPTRQDGGREEGNEDMDSRPASPQDPHAHLGSEAHRLVRNVTQGPANLFRRKKPKSAYARSGQSTPEEPLPDSRRSPSVNGGVLAQLLRLHASQMAPSRSGTDSASVTESEDSDGHASSGAATPKKEKKRWYKQKQSGHSHSLGSLVEAGMNLSRSHLPAGGDLVAVAEHKRPKKKKKHQPRLEDEIRVTVHIADILARQKYIMQLCRAFMMYGAPTHRLEEYMYTTAIVLHIDAQFLYLPGCMIISFDDPSTRTTEVKLVRVVQGVNLGRLAEVHNVYKNIVHDIIGVEEATQDLNEVMSKKPRFNKFIIIAAYGLASTAVGPFAFNARPVDMPIIFILSLIVAFMQHVLSPHSTLYANVFEVSAAILTSFLARAFGSIKVHRNGVEERLFCFSSLAQSSIALILPGFMVLSGSLELQSHQLIAGSIRMVYAIIYSLFLGYGMTVGITVYGLMDGDATKDTQCSGLNVYYSEYLQRFPFVAVYTLLLNIVNQGKWRQAPVMIFISVCGYVTNYFSGKRLGANSEVANTVGAFTIGVIGNLYSRLWHGHAATAILPAIFVLVPSGLSASGSLIAGLNYSEEVKKKAANSDASVNQTSSAGSLGLGMVQVAIGISVGLFVAALIIYPLGKRRSGLFSF